MVWQRQGNRWQIALALLALTWLVTGLFLPILSFEFVDFDVNSSVVNNPHIRGLTGDNLKHIFTSRLIASYYPVRTLTYAVDYAIWGLNPRGFKLTNSLLHWANVMLVFWLVLRALTGPTEPARVRRLRNGQEITPTFSTPSPCPLPRGGEGSMEVISWPFLSCFFVISNALLTFGQLQQMPCRRISLQHGVRVRPTALASACRASLTNAFKIGRQRLTKARVTEGLIKV